MITEIAYRFPTHVLANRFLNELKPWKKHHVKAKLAKDSFEVQVSYTIERGTYTTIAGDLDSLAEQYQGSEC